MYDFSYVKGINPSLYDDLCDYIDACKYNLKTPILLLATTIFEKGIKLFLSNEDKISKFFDYDPNLTMMCLSKNKKYESSKNYVRSNIKLNYDVIVYCRDNSNNKKHDLAKIENDDLFDKHEITKEVFKLLVFLNNRYCTNSVQTPNFEMINELFIDDDNSQNNKEKNNELENLKKEISNIKDVLNLGKFNPENIESSVEKDSHKSTEVDDAVLNLTSEETQDELDNFCELETENRIREEEMTNKDKIFESVLEETSISKLENDEEIILDKEDNTKDQIVLSESNSEVENTIKNYDDNIFEEEVNNCNELYTVQEEMHDNPQSDNALIVLCKKSIFDILINNSISSSDSLSHKCADEIEQSLNKILPKGLKIKNTSNTHCSISSEDLKISVCSSKRKKYKNNKILAFREFLLRIIPKDSWPKYMAMRLPSEELYEFNTNNDLIWKCQKSIYDVFVKYNLNGNVLLSYEVCEDIEKSLKEILPHGLIVKIKNGHCSISSEDLNITKNSASGIKNNYLTAFRSFVVQLLPIKTISSQKQKKLSAVSFPKVENKVIGSEYLDVCKIMANEIVKKYGDDYFFYYKYGKPCLKKNRAPHINDFKNLVYRLNKMLKLANKISINFVIDVNFSYIEIKKMNFIMYSNKYTHGATKKKNFGISHLIWLFYCQIIKTSGYLPKK